MTNFTYRQRWAIAASGMVALWAIGLVVNNGADRPTYTSSQWSDEASLSISRALVNSNIRDCGQYESLDIGKGQYAVRCSMDGVTWKNYTVDLNQNRAY